MSLADRIKDSRKKAGYTQRDLANLLNVKPVTISAWEVGRNEPSISMLKRVASLLNVSFEYLAGVEKNSDNSKDKPLTKNQKLVADNIKSPLVNVDHLLGTEYDIDDFPQPAILNNAKYGKETY